MTSVGTQPETLPSYRIFNSFRGFRKRGEAQSLVIDILRLSKKFFSLTLLKKSIFTAEIPVISPPLTKGCYVEGSSVNISCTATGKPDPEVSWIRNGQIKSSGRRIAYLNFDQIKRTDDGLYTCTANNSAGTKSQKGIVVVCCESEVI